MLHPNPAHAQLVRDLGGSTVVSRALFGHRDRRQMVGFWIKRQHIPFRWRHPVAKLARRDGVPVPEGFFDPEPDTVEAMDRVTGAGA